MHTKWPNKDLCTFRKQVGSLFVQQFEVLDLQVFAEHVDVAADKIQKLLRPIAEIYILKHVTLY